MTDPSRVNIIIFKIIWAMFLLIGGLPRKWAMACGNFFGLLWYRLDKKHRNITIENLARAYGSEKSKAEIKNLSKKVFQNIMQMPFEIGWSFSLNDQNWHKHFQFQGLSNLTSVYARGKGVFLLTAHIGNWELLPLFGKLTGCKGHMIYRPLDFKPLDLFFIWLRTRYGEHVIPKRNSVLKIVRVVKNGEMVVFVTDQSADWYDGVYVDFFGQLTCSNKGLAMMVERTGAPVVPIFIARVGTKYYVDVGREIPMAQTGDPIKDIDVNTQRYNDRIEDFIRRYPEQWFWLHRRWKHKPWCRWPRTGDEK